MHRIFRRKKLLWNSVDWKKNRNRNWFFFYFLKITNLTDYDWILNDESKFNHFVLLQIDWIWNFSISLPLWIDGLCKWFWAGNKQKNKNKQTWNTLWKKKKEKIHHLIPLRLERERWNEKEKQKVHPTWFSWVIIFMIAYCTTTLEFEMNFFFVFVFVSSSSSSYCLFEFIHFQGFLFLVEQNNNNNNSVSSCQNKRKFNHKLFVSGLFVCLLKKWWNILISSSYSLLLLLLFFCFSILTILTEDSVNKILGFLFCFFFFFVLSLLVKLFFFMCLSDSEFFSPSE